jgi:transposase
MTAVREALRGENQREIARRHGVNRTTLTDWIQMQREGGWDALRAKPLNGRPCHLSPDEHRKLEALIERGAQAAGYPDDLWDCRRVAEVIERRFGVRYHVDSVPRVMRRLGYTPQRPEYRAYERDEERIETWVKRDWPRIKKRREAGSKARVRR